MIDIIVGGIGIAILEDATTSRLAVRTRASRALLLFARDEIVMIVDVVVFHVVSVVAVLAATTAFAAVGRIIVDVVLMVALGLVLDVLGVLGTFFPSVFAGAMQLAIALVGAEILGLVAAIATVIMAAVIATAMA